MKILFIHDHKFKLDKFGNYYTDGKFTNELFDRYIFSESDTISVIARSKPLEDKSTKLNLVNHTSLKFELVKGINPIQIFLFNLFYNINIFIKAFSFDINIVRLPSFLGVFFCFLYIIFRKVYFVEVVGHARDSLLDNNSRFLRKLIAKIYSFLTEIIIKNASGAIYVTQFNLQKDYPCLGITEHASNVILRIEKEKNPKESYEILSIPRIGLIGSFNNGYKGIDFTIKTIYEIKKNHHKIINLYILGSGSLLAEYQNLVTKLGLQDQIFFDGLLPLDQVPAWLDQLDLYVQPSLTEGLPRALIEAMSRGLPCLASRVGGIPELLNEEFTFDNFNEEVFSNMILKIMDSANLRAESGEKNFVKSLSYDFEILELKRRKFWKKARNITGKDV